MIKTLLQHFHVIPTNLELAWARPGIQFWDETTRAYFIRKPGSDVVERYGYDSFFQEMSLTHTFTLGDVVATTIERRAARTGQ